MKVGFLAQGNNVLNQFENHYAERPKILTKSTPTFYVLQCIFKVSKAVKSRSYRLVLV